jgi:hypothetical protein
MVDALVVVQVVIQVWCMVDALVDGIGGDTGLVHG